MSEILAQTFEHNLVITINREKVYNALNKSSKLLLAKTINDAQLNNEIRAIIITGSGKAFCTGQDLNDRSGGGEIDFKKTLEEEWNPIINAIRSSKKLVIASVNGVAAGAGLSIALACDMVLSKPKVKFVGGFCKLGLIPDAGSTFQMVHSLGYKRTVEFFTFNQPIFSEELEQVGLINKIVDAPMESALSMGKMIASMPPLALDQLKQNLQKALEGTFESNLENEVKAQTYLGTTNDYKEGVLSFLEKRPPNFVGN